MYVEQQDRVIREFIDKWMTAQVGGYLCNTLATIM
jgi:hypothetical protein